MPHPRIAATGLGCNHDWRRPSRCIEPHDRAIKSAPMIGVFRWRRRKWCDIRLLAEMLTQIEQLLTLQHRDQKIRALNRERTMVPVERKALEEKLAAAGSAFDTLKHKTQELEVEKKKLEIDAQTRRDSIAKFKNQQFQTRKNEEFQALSNEIKRFENEIVSLEDRELEIMEQAERMKSETSVSEKETAQLRAQIAAQLSALDDKIRSIDSQLAELTAERTTRAAAIDEDLLEHYERLFASKNGNAVVALEHEVCMGCHMKITTQTAVRVKSEKEIVGCDQCGRILYPQN
ncbi:MAG: C4-type zinc ribbon domain-containing protein [Verrucomicrobiota bacterium]|nr:C4-type zinc ribbon domain-containing protein [Verrucomicrobiota bacterium]